MAITARSTQSTTTEKLRPLLTALRVHGPESGEFLNRLVISELQKPGALPFTGICNPKGRLLYTFWLLPQTENDFLLFAEPQLAEGLKNFLAMRVFRSKVSIEPADSWKLELSTNASGTPQAKALKHTEPEGNTDALSEKSHADNHLHTPDYWLWMIKHHLPWILPESQGLFIPQQLDLQSHGVVSVDKGCYPGQEIIARLHFLGKNKKHLYHCHTKEAPAQESPSSDPVNRDLTGSDARFCDENEIATIASPFISDSTGQTHFQVVAPRPPDCLVLNDKNIPVSCHSRPRR